MKSTKRPKNSVRKVRLVYFHSLSTNIKRLIVMETNVFKLCIQNCAEIQTVYHLLYMTCKALKGRNKGEQHCPFE